LPADRAIDGASFLPIFADQPIPRQTPLYRQYQRTGSPMKLALRQGPWKLLADPAFKTFELYDLTADEQESKDVADAQPERVRELTAIMKKLHGGINAAKP